MRTYLRKIKSILSRESDSDNSLKLPDDRYKAVKKSDLLPVSVCIPSYEMYGQGAIHLGRSLEALSAQSWKNFEVIVSDHSESDLIKNCCEVFDSKLNINYLRNTENRGSSCENANNALNHAKNPLIRFLFQDDFLADDSAMERAGKYFAWTGASWMATGCNHRDDSDGRIVHNHYPEFRKDQLFEAINTLGCPSVIMLKKNDLRFDRRLPALMDLDYYHKLFELFGEPAVFNDINTTIGVHAGQVTNNGGFEDKVQVRKELDIVASKYNKISKPIVL